jgi:ABC transport system ATP-binding/permease protein
VLTRELADPSLYRDGAQRAQALQQRYAAVEEELLRCLEQWEALEARQHEARQDA